MESLGSSFYLTTFTVCLWAKPTHSTALLRVRNETPKPASLEYNYESSHITGIMESGVPGQYQIQSWQAKVFKLLLVSSSLDP